MIRSNFTKVFRRFLISYIFILIIPLLTGFISYRASIEMAETSSIEMSLSVLNKSKSILDSRMSEVEGFTRQLAINQDLNELLSQNSGKLSDNIYALWKVSRDLSGYARTNDFLQNFYIYLRNFDAVLAPGSVFFRPNHYYGLNHYEDISFEEWKDSLLYSKHNSETMPLQPFVANGRQSNVISFAQSFPLNSFDQPLGNVVIVIDEKKIGNLLESIPEQFGGGWAYIADYDGNILAKTGISEEDIHGLDRSHPDDQTLLITTQSESNGWVYAAGIPKQALMENANMIKVVTWSVTGGTLAIGLIVCLILAYRSSRPLQSLIANNKSLQVELHQQIPILRDAFLKRLINGELNSSRIIQDLASQSGVTLVGSNGYMGILRIDGYGSMENSVIYSELNVARFVVKQVLKDLCSDVYTTDRGSDQVAVLFLLETDDMNFAAASMEETLQQLRDFLDKHYKITLTAAFSSPFHSLTAISRSYDEAKETLASAYTFEMQHRLLWYKDLNRQTSIYHYPLDLELRLMNAVKTGEQDEARRILTQVFEQNFVERDISAEMAVHLLAEVRATLIKSFEFKNPAQPQEIEDYVLRLGRIQLTEGWERARSNLSAIIEEYCAFVLNSKYESGSHLVKNIMSYLESHFGNADLTIHMIAEAAGRSEKIVSQLFKEQTGLFLSEYVEKIRIQKATELLRSTNRTIEEITAEVGYNSSHSFRRAFKRLMGVTPNQYRSTVSM